MGWMGTRKALSKLPELLLRGRMSIDFDGTPLEARGLSFKKRINLIKAGIDSIFRPSRVLALPAVIQIEPTNICNLSCPLCPSGLNEMKRPKGHMSLDMFREIIDQLDDALAFAILYGWGEPFLNMSLLPMIRACADRGISTLTSTNGQVLQSIDDALRVVDSGLSALIIAIDGSTQEIYGSYRKNGDLEKVKRCASVIEEAKARRGAKHPYTNLRVVVSTHNQDDIPNLEALARELNVNMFSCKTLGCLPDKEHFGEFEPDKEDMCRFDYEGESRKRRPPIICNFPFRQPTVFWDGTIVGCEFDYESDFSWGQVGKQSFPSIWNSRQARKHRESIRRRKGQPMFCDVCPYRDRVQDGAAIMRKELRPA